MEISKVIGVMSGTSLDGLDIALCEFSGNPLRSYKILHATTISYDSTWKARLANLHSKSALEYVFTDRDFGRYIAEEVNKFIVSKRIQPQLIASHGHTVFHQPGKGLTAQIGNGSVVAAVTGIPVVSNFRVLDVALGGQGAPLVPVGDRYLFGDYDYCLNLGGIANISMEKIARRVAWDICPANMLLNFLARKEGKAFDRSGELAASGKVNNSLLDSLTQWTYYDQSPPKSIGREDVERFFIPLLEKSDVDVLDALRTTCEHIAIQIGRVARGKGKSMLITGGGALNNYLISRIRQNTDCTINIPERTLIEYKEALVFAFLGLLRWRNEVNCFASVTGASRDCSVGEIAFP